MEGQVSHSEKLSDYLPVTGISTLAVTDLGAVDEMDVCLLLCDGSLADILLY